MAYRIYASVEKNNPLRPQRPVFEARYLHRVLAARALIQTKTAHLRKD